MERRIRATEARIRFGTLMRQVVERGGHPYVVLLSYEDYQHLQAMAQPQDWESVLAEGIKLAREVWVVREGEPLPPPEEVILERGK